jgi:hypothetical protein
MAMDGGGPCGAARQRATPPLVDELALYIPPRAPVTRPGRAPDIVDTFCPADGSAMAPIAAVLSAARPGPD